MVRKKSSKGRCSNGRVKTGSRKGLCRIRAAPNRKKSSKRKSPKRKSPKRKSPKKLAKSGGSGKTKTTTHNGNKLTWSRGSGNKKYKVVINFKDGRRKTVQFGAKGYEHFKDSTPLKLYSNKNHGDSQRRKSYRARHALHLCH